jgi:uncharacterized membrane protein YjgN (DUF898 family)
MQHSPKGVHSTTVPCHHIAMTDSPLAAEPAILEILEFAYVRRPGLFKIVIVNFLLGLITLSIWHFWGKTKVRRHIWSCIHINGEPLEYTGTGGELFRGFLLVFVIFILPYLLLYAGLSLYLGPGHPALQAVTSLFALLGYLLGGYAIYKARNFQLSRTNWRGIRGNMAGSAGLYSLTYFGNILARSFSLGWATPVMNVVMSEQMIGDMRFGDAAFKFKGRAGPLYPTYALCWFLTFFALIGGMILVGVTAYQWFGPKVSDALARIFHEAGKGSPTSNDDFIFGFIIFAVFAVILVYMLIIPMLWSIYAAVEMSTLANYTRFDGAQFKLKATAGSIIWLVVGNLLLLVFTLTLARPFIIQRNISYVFKRLRLDGAVDLNRIRQSIAAKPTRGEGLADAFDLGAW